MIYFNVLYTQIDCYKRLNKIQLLLICETCAHHSRCIRNRRKVFLCNGLSMATTEEKNLCLLKILSLRYNFAELSVSVWRSHGRSETFCFPVGIFSLVGGYYYLLFLENPCMAFHVFLGRTEQ